jgi:hypothetical protein
VHSLNDLEKPVQKITLDPAFQDFSLSYSPYGISVRDISRDERLAMAKLTLLGGKLTPPQPPRTLSNQPEPEDPPSGSGLTPPSSPTFPRQSITPQRGSSLGKPPLGVFSTAIAETLVIGTQGVQAISPTPAVLKLEKLCGERRMSEATQVVDEERRKGRRGEFDGDKVSLSLTLLMKDHTSSYDAIPTPIPRLSSPTGGVVRKRWRLLPTGKGRS